MKKSKTETRHVSAYSETVVDVLCAVFCDCNIFQKYLFSELVTFLFTYVKMVSCDCHVALRPSLRVEGGGGRGREREREREREKCNSTLFNIL